MPVIRLVLLASFFHAAVSSMGYAQMQGSAPLTPGSLLSHYLRGEGGTKSQRRGMAGRPERAAKQRTGERVLERVDALLRMNKLRTALQLLDKATRGLPTSIPIRLARAHVLERLGREGAARALYREVLDLDADNLSALTALGTLLVDRGGDPAGGERLLRRVLDLKPGHAGAYDGLGWLAYKQGKIDRAEKLFEKSRAASPNFPQALYHLGLVALQRKDMAKALTCFQTVVQRDPSHDRGHLSLALLYEKLGERQKAKAEYSKALVLIGTTGPVAARIMNALRKLDPHWRPVDSLASLQQVTHPGLPRDLLPAQPSVAVATTRRVAATAAAQQPSAGASLSPLAATHSRTAATHPAADASGAPVTPASPDARAVKRVSLLPDPAPVQAAAPATVLEQAVATSRGLVHRSLVADHMRLGRLYYEVGLMRDAAGEFQTVINLAPLSDEARDAVDIVEALVDFSDPSQEEKLEGYLKVGATLFQRADLENAKLQYKKVLLLEPEHGIAHKNLAYVYLKEGRENEAWTHVTQALRKDPSNPEALVLRGYVQARRRNFSDAEASFLSAAKVVDANGRLGRYAREMAEKMALFTDLR